MLVVELALVNGRRGRVLVDGQRSHGGRLCVERGGRGGGGGRERGIAERVGGRGQAVLYSGRYRCQSQSQSRAKAVPGRIGPVSGESESSVLAALYRSAGPTPSRFNAGDAGLVHSAGTQKATELPCCPSMPPCTGREAARSTPLPAPPAFCPPCSNPLHTQTRRGPRSAKRPHASAVSGPRQALPAVCLTDSMPCPVLMPHASCLMPPSPPPALFRDTCLYTL